MVTDPIADMLTQIRNGQAVAHQTVIIPFSKIKFALAKLLEKEGLLAGVETQGRKINKAIEIKLKYEKGLPVISGLKKISKPGQRIYIKASQIRPIKQGYGLAVISTSQGLMTNKEAKSKGLGGELLCEIW